MQIDGRDAMRIVRFCVALLCFIVVLIVPALAQEKYPNRPVRFVVSFAAGGSNDIIARVLCDWLSEHLGQQFIVENRPGGSGNVGAASVISSSPDGYTVMFVGPNNAISASVFKKLPFDFLRDTAPVGGIMTLINIMVVPPSLPVKTVAEFIAYGRANPGKLNMASPGAGTSPHMSGELFKMLAGIEMQHIPYRGAGPAYPDLMTGKVDVMFDNLPGAVEFVKTGKLRALAVTSAQRSFVFPDLPTIGETIPGFDVSLYYGVAAPKGTPPEVIAVLNKALNAALADPKMKARIAEFGGTPLSLAPAEFGKLVADETEKWAKVVKTVGLSIE
jgi:tripartite-type tricarboxylate transporter receptor subunit TctC